MKTIIVVGVLDVKGSTNISIAKSFTKFGYSVIPINYRTIIGKYGMDQFEQLLFKTIVKYSPKIVLFCKTNGINPNVIKRCGDFTTTLYWFMDPIETAKLCGAADLAKNANFVACTGGGVVDWMVENGVENCYRIFEGIDHDIFKPVTAIPDFKADISFIGTKTAERDKFIIELQSAGYDVKAYGNGYGGEVVNKAFAQVCASSKMMLSINTFSTIPDYCSDRLFRCMSCGVCTIHYDPTRTMHKYVEDGKEVVLFESIDEMMDKVQGLSDEDIANIAIFGREKILKNYTWDHTVNSMLKLIGK